MSDQETVSEESQADVQAADAPPQRERPSKEVLDEAKEDALDFLEGLLDSMDLDGEVEVEITEEEGIAAAIVDGELGVLIGRRGQTLESVQELLRTAVQRRARTHIHITLDIEGYRDRRREAVAELAKQMAERALEEGEVELDPMPAFERKVVHDTVAEISGVVSFSEGQEPRRRVILQAEDEESST